MRVMFYVQHLLGIGHIRRAALLSSALSKQGMQVTVILGGRDVPEIDFKDATIIRLPAAHVADHNFSPLLDENNMPVDDDWKNHRKENLLAIFEKIKPDVILFEMYPFGRWQFRFELEPLLEAAKAAQIRPFTVCSVRDILVKKLKPKRNLEITTLIREHFDLVLVHGDEALTTLDNTFPEACEIADLIHYTGYVAAPRIENSSTVGTGEVIVSVGGGAVGLTLLNTALKARDQCRLATRTWRFLTGPNLPDSDFQNMRKQAPEGVIIERYRADLQQMMGNCALSISQGGYNTVIDLLQAKTKAIIVPYDDGGESEQLQRARLLGEKNVFKIVEAQTLTVASLSKAIDEAIDTEFSNIDSVNLSGAETTASIIAEHVSSPKHHRRSA